MSGEMETFGTFEGTPVRRVSITDGTLTANVIEWGAVVQDLRLAGHDAPLVLGFETFDPYPAESPYFGAIAGRVANRIRNASAPLDGRTIEVDANVRGVHHLHGGSKGLGKRVWSIVERDADRATLEIVSPDGEMGYPGRLVARCTYRVADGALHVELSAETDAPTWVNLAHHSYFNLHDGGRTPVLDHALRLDADRYLETDEDFVAGGEPLPVGGTRHDWREAAVIGAKAGEEGEPPVWDHNYCLSGAPRALVEVARVDGPTGTSMSVSTTEPGLQFYAGHKIATTSPGLGGIAYGPRSGLCLEAQRWPDAPNNPSYPSIELRPDETYRQHTIYAFGRG